jgi:hypothetical protein
MECRGTIPGRYNGPADTLSMRMLSQVDVLAEVSKRLEAIGIAYMLTGALAQNYYAVERMTADVDIVVDLEMEDVPRLLEEFQTDYYVSRESVLSAVQNRSQFNLIHLECVIKVDCIVTKKSEYAEIAFGRRQPAEVAGAHTFVVSKEDLILSRLLWTKRSESERQLHDLRGLLSTGYDDAYVESWAGRLGVKELLGRCRDG